MGCLVSEYGWTPTQLVVADISKASSGYMWNYNEMDRGAALYM